MASAPTVDSQIHPALEACASALRRIADYELEPALEHRILDLGERKEFLSQAEYDELTALVGFTTKRHQVARGQACSQPCPASLSRIGRVLSAFTFDGPTKIRASSRVLLPAAERPSSAFNSTILKCS